jgi:hypothetical protein
MQTSSSTEQLLQEKEKEWQQKLADVQVKSHLKSALDLRQIFVPPHLTSEEEKERHVQQQKKAVESMLLTDYTPKIDDKGNITWYDNDGKAHLNLKDGKPKNIGAILDERFSYWFVPTTHSVSGTGTGVENVNQSPRGFSSKEQIHKYLASKGLDVLSKEYQHEFETLAEEGSVKI